MLGPIVESPNMWAPEMAAIAGTDTALLALLLPTLPARDFPQKEAREYGLQWANPVTWNPPLEVSSLPPHPLERNLDPRDFTRTTASPAILLEQSLNPVNATAIEKDSVSTLGEPMEIANQPRPPADRSIWHGGALPPSVIAPLLGDLARLNFAAEGGPRFDPPPPSAEAFHDGQPQNRDRQGADAEADFQPPSPNLQAVSVTLQAVSASIGQPVTPVVPHLRPALEVRAPEPSALPLRPTITLAPVTKPAASAPPAPSLARPAQKVSFQRRTDVRIVPVPKSGQAVPVKPVEAKPAGDAPVETIPVDVKPAGSTPVSMPAPKAAVDPKAASKAAIEPVAEPAPKPAAVPASKNKPARHNTPGSTLIAPEITADHKPLAGVANLGLPELQTPLHNVEEQSAWQKLPLPIKLGMAATLCLTLVGFAYMTFSSGNAVAKAPPPPKEAVYELGRAINTNGWVEDWAPRDPARRITLVRGSEPFSNYRFDFNAQIDAKAVGWMFRALNPRNFYVAKLEKLTSGLEPEVAFVRYAVIEGRNETPVSKKLTMKTRIDTNYKVHFEAIGPKFTVWIMGEKFDEWTDPRLGSGGVGFYSEAGEFAALQGNINLYELVEKK
jgi:hypothetical protein